MYTDKMKAPTILKRNVDAQFQNTFQCEKQNSQFTSKFAGEKRKSKTIQDETTIFKMDLCTVTLEAYKANKTF